MSIGWRGVFPAVTTQVREDLSIDLADTQRVVDDLVNDGVTGVIALGTVGENNSLDYDEKVTVLTAIVEAVAGRVPVITGVSEYDTRRAVRYAQAAEKAGADGLMLLPPMVYVPKAHELVNHFKGVADQTGLPIMLYNNPPAYRTVIDQTVLEALVDVKNIVAVRNRPRILAASPISAMRSAIAIPCSRGSTTWHSKVCIWAQGWVSGLTNAFPSRSSWLRHSTVAITPRRWKSIAGSCRSSISTPSMTSSSRSSWPSRSWAVVRNACCRRATCWKANAVPR